MMIRKVQQWSCCDDSRRGDGDRSSVKADASSENSRPEVMFAARVFARIARMAPGSSKPQRARPAVAPQIAATGFFSSQEAMRATSIAVSQFLPSTPSAAARRL